jgi:NAD(P)H-hydrate epimerase
MGRVISAVTVQEAREIDLKAQDKLGIPALLLMENAGRAVAEEAIKIVAKKKPRVAIFCGKGNNGGDGFCAARHLLVAGINPDIYLVGKIKEVKNQARTNLDILINLGNKVFEIDSESLSIVKSRIFRYKLIIDSLLGVGLKGDITGVMAQLIGLINCAKANILSVDIPSGLDATSGKVLGCCIKADRTVTFIAKKLGMIRGKGLELCGKIKVADIGAPLLDKI